MEIDTSLLFTIWTTTNCNLRCTYCYEGADKPQSVLHSETVEKIILFIADTVRERNCKSIWVVFHGGEPCLNFDAVKLFLKLASAALPSIDIRYGMTTNATLLNEEMIEVVKHFHDITVSIDGTKQWHDRHRVFADGSGSYALALKNALILQKLHGAVRIRMTVTPDSVADLFDGVKNLLSLGFQTIIPAVDYFSADWTENEMAVLQQELLQVKQFITAHCDKAVFVGMTDAQELVELGVCTGGRNSFHIAPDGTIYPCVYVVGNHTFCCGSVENGINEAALQALDKINAAPVESCRGCSCYSACLSSRCKLLNNCLTGSFFIPSPVVCGTQNVCMCVYRS